MGYLVCKNCRGYYKLQDGEKPEDFSDKCACGGNLRYALDIEVVGNNTSQKTNKDQYKETSKIKNNFNEKGTSKINPGFKVRPIFAVIISLFLVIGLMTLFIAFIYNSILVLIIGFLAPLLCGYLTARFINMEKIAIDYATYSGIIFSIFLVIMGIISGSMTLLSWIGIIPVIVIFAVLGRVGGNIYIEKKIKAW